MTDLLSYSLVSVAEAQLVLGISGNDDKLRFLLNYATDFIEKYTGRRIVQTTYATTTAEKLDGNGTRELFLKNYPVSTISLLEFNATGANEDQWETVDSKNYFFDADTGIISLTYPTTKGHGNYRVSYTGGYSPVPSDLKTACIFLAGEAFKKGGSMGIKSESLGDHSIVFDASLMSQEGSVVKSVLNRYRRMVLPIC